MVALSGLTQWRSVVGPMVECSPATRAIRVRFSDDALDYSFLLQKSFTIVQEFFFLIFLLRV